jgi:hypothetical protein
MLFDREVSAFVAAGPAAPDTAAASPAAVPAASQLSDLMSRYWSFSSLASRRRRPPPVAASTATTLARLSHADLAVAQADRSRFGLLCKLLQVNLRSATRVQHVGSLALASTRGWSKAAAAHLAAAGLTPDAGRWVYAMRRMATVLVQQIGDTR